MEKNKVPKNLVDSESTNDSDLSEICHSVEELMAESGQMDPIKEEAEPPVQPPNPAERLSSDEWSNMTKTQRRNFLRRRREARREAGPSKEIKKELGSGKRPRETTGLTPSPNKVERKRPKLEGPKYSYIVNSHKVAIMHKEHPKEELSEESCNNLIIKMVDEMKKNDPEKGSITFCGCNIRTGALVISCTDERSKNWISECITRLSPWEGQELKVGDPKLLEGFRRIGSFIPKPVESMDTALVNIRAQNGLNTDHWKILPGGCKMQPKGLYFVASIPESQFKKIEAKGFRVGHGFHMIEIKPLKEKPDQPVDTMEVDKSGGEGDKEPAAAMGGLALGGSGGIIARVNPDLPGGDLPSDRRHPSGGRGKPSTAASTGAASSGAGAGDTLQRPLGGRRGSAAGADRPGVLPGVADGSVGGKNRDSRGKPVIDPPTQ